MPSFTIIHAAVFTAGALIGGGITAAVSSRQKHTQTRTSEQGRTPAPVIDVDPSGKTKLSSIGATSDLTPVLRYGHPGTLYAYDYLVHGRNITRLL